MDSTTELLKLFLTVAVAVAGTCLGAYWGIKHEIAAWSARSKSRDDKISLDEPWDS
jgi:hypothetical protein